MKRRGFLATCAASTALGTLPSLVQSQPEGWGTFVEAQQGDPKLAAEIVTVDPVRVAALSSGDVRATFRPRDSTFLPNLVTAAGTQVGYSRTKTRTKIVDYLDIFDLPYESGGKPTPFCAAGVVWVAAQQYAAIYKIQPTISGFRSVLAEIDRYHFYPSPSVWDMVNVAKGKRKWKAFNDGLAPQMGWLVVFDWKRRGNADHVGIVEGRAASGLKTIEFNTSDDNPSNGGQVARKNRAFDKSILGFIATDLRPPFEKN